jgi:CRP-like cAMP-binding protein
MTQGKERRGSPVRQVEVSPLHCTPADVRRILAGTPFFSSLSADDIDIVARDFRQNHFVAGATIHLAGGKANRLSIVAAGMVKLVRPTPEGQEVLLEILGPGDYFGSLATLGDATYADDASAHTDCCVLQASARDFQGLLERYPSVTLATLAFVAGRLRGAHETIEQLSARPVEQRVAATLLKLADRVGRQRREDVLIEMPLSRQDLADMTGTTVETASRVMSELRRSGTIDSGRRWISIVNRAALEAVASGERRR